MLTQFNEQSSFNLVESCPRMDEHRRLEDQGIQPSSQNKVRLFLHKIHIYVRFTNIFK